MQTGESNMENMAEKEGRTIELPEMSSEKTNKGDMMEEKKPFKIEIEWKYLEKIAEFYEFPVAVFLGHEKIFPPSKLTRNQILFEKAEMFERIKDIMDEYKSEAELK